MLERQSLQQIVLRKLDSYMLKKKKKKRKNRRKFDPSLTPYTKISSKFIKDLNVRLDTIKFLEESIGRTHFDINCSNIFFKQSPSIMEIKTKTNK